MLKIPISSRHQFSSALLALALVGGSGAAVAQAVTDDADYWRLVVSPYTLHFGADDDNDREAVYGIGLERQRADDWFWGGTYFSNSFGQPSGFVYVGQRYGNLFSVDKLFAKWSAGILYGYKEPYEDKVPFNYNGWSPGVVLSMGWQFTRQFSMQANLLGTAGLMLQMSIDFR